MIREYKLSDLDIILDIWLTASINSHRFISSEFWESQLEDMRDIYIPNSETYVFERDRKVAGFYSLNGSSLAAIFVYPHVQGQGIGKQLLSHAKSQRSHLTLSVYKENTPSYHFYLSQGFLPIKEQLDKHTGHIEYLMSNKAQ
ncbi:N-acetyltransferase [Microbulbifer sp. ANSA001]|uniref:N-acetyltransferase n=1 Tax=Microbulbifer sp. ANSA001 TaxID=3243358 RepID=UPI0040436C4C